jgi:PhoPQ-activated pathogenicity-related protein
MLRLYVTALVLSACALASAFAPAHAEAASQLASFVAAPDTSYAWRTIKSSRLGSAEIVELGLTSQTWRGIDWKHQLFIVRPSNVDAASRQAFLFVHGGRWRAVYEAGADTLPREAKIFVRLAESLRAPVAVLRQVPFQPIFERREDALIAYTFDRYLETGDSDWPLLQPMVKSAVRAMDAVQAYAREHWSAPIEAFAVAGASKRGWTSWLTAAVDPRVAGVAPMVIDMLNLPAQIELQRTTFGGLSEQVEDYADIGLAERIDSERGRGLLAIVDPYQYRADLGLPKLILLATNDRYWPLDALRLYWDELPEPKRVLYVPNQGHGVRDLDRLIGGLSALHRYAGPGRTLPAVSWTYGSTTEHLRVNVRADREPRSVRLWSATSATRDFREARWSSERCQRRGEAHDCSVTRPEAGFVALYAELWFKDARYPKFPLATVVCIAEARGGATPAC